MDGKPDFSRDVVLHALSRTPRPRRCRVAPDLLIAASLLLEAEFIEVAGVGMMPNQLQGALTVVVERAWAPGEWSIE